MIEAGEVGAVFTIVDEASPILRALMEQFNALQATIDRTKLALKELVMPPGLTASVGRMTKSFNEAAGALGKVKLSISEAGAAAEGTAGKVEAIGGAAVTAAERMGAAFNTSLDATQAKVAQVAEEIRAVGAIPIGAVPVGRGVSSGAAVGAADGAGGTTAEDLGFVAAASAPPRRHGERPGHRRATAMSSGEGGRGFTIAEGPGVSIPGGGRMSVSPSGEGFWPLVAGAATAWSGFKLLEAGGERQTQEKLLHDILGSHEKPGDVPTAVGLAQKWASDHFNGVIGSSVTENLEGLREIVPVTPTLESAEKIYPGIMRAAKLLEELTGGKKKAFDQIQPLAKSLEQLGGGIDPKTHELDPDRLAVATQEAAKTIIAGGGMIDANSLLAYAKTAGAVGRLSPDMSQLFDAIMTPILDMGGSRAGTASSALGRQFLGQKMTKQSALRLQELGILPEGGWEAAGGGIAMKPGYHLKGEDEIKDPEKGLKGFVNDVWAPAAAAQLKKENMPETLPNMLQEAIKDYGTQTGQRLALLYWSNKAQVDKDIALRHGVNPEDAYKGMVEHDFGANMTALSKSINDFAGSVGSPGVDAAIQRMQQMSGVFSGISAAAIAHPDVAKGALDGLAGIAGALLGAGALKRIGGALKFLFGENLLSTVMGGIAKFVLPAAILTTVDSVLGGLGLKSLKPGENGKPDELIQPKPLIPDVGQFLQDNVKVGPPGWYKDRNDAQAATSLFWAGMSKGDVVKDKDMTALRGGVIPPTPAPPQDWVTFFKTIVGLAPPPVPPGVIAHGFVQPEHPHSVAFAGLHDVRPPPPPPPPKVNVQVTAAPVTVKGEIKSSPVTLNIDGHAIANAIIPFIMGEMRSMINFSGHNDTQVYQPAPPGAYGLPVR